jgi:drug/metabolite transporter (DMT)-like permease
MYIILFVICVFVSACSQILLKIAAGKGYSGLKIYFNKYVMAGFCIFVAVTLVTVTLYRRLDLSTGALLESLSYIFIPVLSAVVLKEKISRTKIFGIALILCGVLVYGIWGSA